MDTQETESPRDFSNELQGSPNIAAMPSDSSSRYQAEGDLKTFNCTEDSKLESTETTKSKCPTQLRNRKKRKLLKCSDVHAELPGDFSNELQGSPEMPSDSNSRYQAEDDLKPINCTEDSKLNQPNQSAQHRNLKKGSHYNLMI